MKFTRGTLLQSNQIEFDRLLKHGREFETWLARSPTGEALAVKISSQPDSHSARQQFSRISHVLAGANLQSLPQVFAIGEEQGHAYLALSYVEGLSLQQRLELGPIPLANFFSLARSTLKGLEALHNGGLLHRDVKPANIILNKSNAENATLIDFGFADKDAYKHREDDSIVGTLRYMAPEQSRVLQREIGPHSDLYSLGAVLLEALSGKPVFNANTSSEVLRQHLSVQPPLLRDLGITAPRALDDWLQLMLKKEPRERFASAAEALKDLDQVEAAYLSGSNQRLQTSLSNATGLSEADFIGRQNELKALQSEVDQSTTGHGRIVLLEAESGGGKTRLLKELSRRYDWVVMGQGKDVAAQRPFQILIDVIGSILAKSRKDRSFRSRLTEKLKDQAEAICEIIPEFNEIFVVMPAAVAPPEALGEIRGIRAIAALLDSLGTQSEPALVILDDCQWADDLSLKLLAFWQQAADETQHTPRYTTIVASFRSEEVLTEHRLRSLKHVTSIVLRPFGASDIESIVESMVGVVPASVHQTIAHLSQGNPFMASAIVHGLVESGALTKLGNTWAVDEHKLAEARASRKAAYFLAKRLKVFPEPTLALLSIGAVLGKEFHLETVSALANVATLECVDRLEIACDRQVIWPAVNGRYTFVHDKIRETLLDLLPVEERQKLHSKAARLLDFNDKENCFDLAYHFYEGGELSLASPYALSAAQQARAQYSLQIAERYFRMALAGISTTSAEEKLVASEGLGDVLMLLGRYDDASAQFLSARDVATDRLVKARIEGKIGELLFKQGDVSSAALAVESALRLLDCWAPTRTIAIIPLLIWEAVVQTLHTIFPAFFLARRKQATPKALQAIRMYSRLAYIYWFGKGKIFCGWAHLRETNLAETYPAGLELAQAYSEHAPVITMIPWYARGIAYARKSFEIRKQFGDVWGQGQSLHFYGVVLYSSSQFGETIEKCNDALRLLERTGDQWEVNTARWHLGYSYYRLGRLQEAVATFSETYHSALAINDHQAAGIALSGWAKSSAGRVPLDFIAKELKRAVGDTHTGAEVLQAHAICLLGRGQAREAVESLEKAAILVRKGGLRQEYVAPVQPWLATALREMYETTPSLRALERQETLQRLKKCVRRAVRISRSYRNNLPHALREKALLEAITGRPKKAKKYFDLSIEVAKSQNAKYEQALSAFHRARLCFEMGFEMGWADTVAELKIAEIKLKSFDPPAPEAQAESASLIDRFDSVLEAGHAIASAISKDNVLAAVHKTALILLRGEECEVFETSEDGALEPYKIPNKVLHKIQLSQKLIRQALERRKPVIFSALTDSNPSESIIVSEAKSTLVAPIMSHNKVVACFYVVHQQIGGLFGTEEIRLAQFIATLAGAALENSEGFLRIQNLSEERRLLHTQAEEALKARDIFLSVASHELKTPLNSMQLQSQFVLRKAQKEGFESVPQQVIEGLVSNTSKQVHRMSRLIEDLLDVSRASTGEFSLNLEPTDLSQLVREVLQRFAGDIKAANCEVLFRSQTSNRIMADKLRLEQIIINLLTNALKYAPGMPIEITLRKQDRWILLSVLDRGPGIPAEAQSRIFARFERAVSGKKISGLGLGLYIASELSKAHGGRLEVQSSLGQGSTFTLALPESETLKSLQVPDAFPAQFP